MIFYLADIENIAHRWHEFTSLANPGDQFLLFYSKNVGPVRMGLFGPASVRGVEFKFIECRIGPNAMDFQIATELGRLVALHPNDRFVVLSKDTGFDIVVKYWTDRGIDISRQAPAHNGQHLRMDAPHETDREPSDGGPPSGGSIHPDSECAPTPEGIPSEQVPGSEPEDKAVQHEGGISPDEPKPTEPKPETPGQAVRRTYHDLLAAAGLSGEELRIATGIVYAAMRYQPNARRLQAYNRFKQRYGREKGLEQYNIVKDAVRQISADGPFPPGDSDGSSEQPDPAQKVAAEAGPAAKPVPATMEGIKEAIKEACPGLMEKKYDKILRIIQHARKSKNSEHIYSRQLRESIGEPQAGDIYRKTLYLLKP